MLRDDTLKVAAAVLLLNVSDALFTLFWVRWGMATETNPAMADLVTVPAIFVATKMALVCLGLSLLVIRRRHWLAATGLMVALVVYMLLFLAVHAPFALQLIASM